MICLNLFFSVVLGNDFKISKIGVLDIFEIVSVRGFLYRKIEHLLNIFMDFSVNNFLMNKIKNVCWFCKIERVMKNYKK